MSTGNGKTNLSADEVNSRARVHHLEAAITEAISATARSAVGTVTLTETLVALNNVTTRHLKALYLTDEEFDDERS